MKSVLAALISVLGSAVVAAAPPSMSPRQWNELLGWPDFCTSTPPKGSDGYPPLILVDDGCGGHLLTVVCTPGMYHHCSLLYPVDLKRPSATDPLRFHQVVQDAEGGKRLVEDRWICGRGGISIHPQEKGVVAFEHSIGPGGCGLINIYDLARQYIDDRIGGGDTAIWPVAVRELSCALPEVHRRQIEGITYESPFDWPPVDGFRSLPRMDPFVEGQWPELGRAP